MDMRGKIVDYCPVLTMKGGRRGVQVSLKSQDQARCGKATSMRYQSERAREATGVENCLSRFCQAAKMAMSVVDGKESGGCVQRGRTSRNARVQRNVMTTSAVQLSKLRSTRRMIFGRTSFFFSPDDRQHFSLCQTDVYAHTFQGGIIVIIAC